MAQNRAPTILLIEDDAVLSASLVELLEQAGYHPVAVPNSRNALNYLRSNPPPALIVLALMLPVLSGTRFRREQLLDPMLSRIPVIVHTALWANEHICPLGAVEWFPKPADPEEFLRAIARHCRREEPRAR